jgi:hypothetical protein
VTVKSIWVFSLLSIFQMPSAQAFVGNLQDYLTQSEGKLSPADRAFIRQAYRELKRNTPEASEWDETRCRFSESRLKTTLDSSDYSESLSLREIQRLWLTKEMKIRFQLQWSPTPAPATPGSPFELIQRNAQTDYVHTFDQLILALKKEWIAMIRSEPHSYRLFLNYELIEKNWNVTENQIDERLSIIGIPSDLVHPLQGEWAYEWEVNDLAPSRDQTPPLESLRLLEFTELQIHCPQLELKSNSQRKNNSIRFPIRVDQAKRRELFRRIFSGPHANARRNMRCE